MFFLSGVAKYLFVPMAEAVVFAMLASYLLSRTVVPTMSKYLLKGHEDGTDGQARKSRNPFTQFQLAFNRSFERVRNWYRSALELCLEYRAVFLVGIVVFWAASLGVLYPWLGQDFSFGRTVANSSFTSERIPALVLRTPRGSAIRSKLSSNSKFPGKSELDY